MAENKDYITHNEDRGSINVSDDVIARIASAAAAEVEGVDALAAAKTEDWARRLGKKGMPRGVKVDIEGEIVNIDVYIIVKLNYPINDVALKVQDAVIAAVESATGFGVTSANIHVSGVAVK